MLNAEQRTDLLRQAFVNLQAHGHEWVDMKDAARYAITFHEGYMRRRFAINRVLGAIGINRSIMPKKAPFQYRTIEFPMAAEALEANGEIEYKYINGDGELFDPPPRDPFNPPKLNYMDRRYRYIPPTVEFDPTPQPEAGTIQR